MEAGPRWRARRHARVRTIRQDALHTLTHQLATTYGMVVAEQMHVAGMGKNRRLTRALAHAALAEIRRQLRYKCSWYGAVLVEAPPCYPSSKRCSRCGPVKGSLPRAERTFRCEACGLSLDRDENAARISRPWWATSPGVAGDGKRPWTGRKTCYRAGGSGGSRKPAPAHCWVRPAPPIREDWLLEADDDVSGHGKDHRGTFPYVEACCVDRGWRLDVRRMRTGRRPLRRTNIQARVQSLASCLPAMTDASTLLPDRNAGAWHGD